MDRIDDLFTLVDHLRSDMKDLRSDLKELRAEAHRDFRWVVGIQLTTMAAVIGALIGVLYRQ